MTRTGKDAIAFGNTITSGYAGYCLRFVRTCFDVPGKYLTAAEAWANAKYKHNASTTAGIPAGVPIFMGKNHVALYVGNGNMRTTNSGTGKVSTVPVTSWGSNYPLHGWSEDLNGVRVYTAPKPAAKPKAPGWYSVNVSKGHHLNGRSGPSKTAKVKYKRKPGFKLYAAKKVTGDGLTWLVTNYGTYYALEYCKKVSK